MGEQREREQYGQARGASIYLASDTDAAIPSVTALLHKFTSRQRCAGVGSCSAPPRVSSLAHSHRPNGTQDSLAFAHDGAALGGASSLALAQRDEAMLDWLILARSKQFVGTRGSTFTMAVAMMRREGDHSIVQPGWNSQVCIRVTSPFSSLLSLPIGQHIVGSTAGWLDASSVSCVRSDQLNVMERVGGTFDPNVERQPREIAPVNDATSPTLDGLSCSLGCAEFFTQLCIPFFRAKIRAQGVACSLCTAAFAAPRLRGICAVGCTPTSEMKEACPTPSHMVDLRECKFEGDDPAENVNVGDGDIDSEGIDDHGGVSSQTISASDPIPDQPWTACGAVSGDSVQANAAARHRAAFLFWNLTDRTAARGQLHQYLPVTLMRLPHTKREAWGPPSWQYSYQASSSVERSTMRIFELLESQCDQGGLVVELGANEGSYGRLASSMGCRVLSVEPQSACIRLLAFAVALVPTRHTACLVHGFVGTRQLAITVPPSPCSGLADFSHRKGSLSAPLQYQQLEAEEEARMAPRMAEEGAAFHTAARAATVRTVRLDVLADENVLMIKCDVEVRGHPFCFKPRSQVRSSSHEPWGR